MSKYKEGDVVKVPRSEWAVEWEDFTNDPINYTLEIVQITSRGPCVEDNEYRGKISSGRILSFNEEYILEEPTILDSDEVFSSPIHYTSHPSGIEPIQITKYETFMRGNIIKYIMRAPYKGKELSDLKKARQFLEWEIERVENE